MSAGGRHPAPAVPKVAPARPVSRWPSLYVAGPMSGLPDFNYPTFNAAADLLRKAGFGRGSFTREGVESPTRGATRAEASPLPWDEYLRMAIGQLIRVEGVAVLPGWEGSKGARLEVHIADELGMPVATVDDWLEYADELRELERAMEEALQRRSADALPALPGLSRPAPIIGALAVPAGLRSGQPDERGGDEAEAEQDPAGRA